MVALSNCISHLSFSTVSLLHSFPTLLKLKPIICSCDKFLSSLRNARRCLLMALDSFFFVLFCDTRDHTQSLVHGKQALYH